MDGKVRKTRPSQKTCLQIMPSKAFEEKLSIGILYFPCQLHSLFTALTDDDEGSLNLPRDENTS
jgi:hypothetical protein